MSVELKAVPPWKQALIEKKRKQEHEDRPCSNTEADKISVLPSWRRDILTKKQQTKNSLVFLGEKSPQTVHQVKISKDTKEINESGLQSNPSSPISNNGDVLLLYNKENSTNGRENKVPSFGKNPWLKADPSVTSRNSKSKTNRHSDPMSDIQLNHVSNNHSWSETDGVHGKHNNSEISDEVFQDEEVTYGRGFVHKLLKRFSHMSSYKEEEEKKIKRSSGRLSRSSENLLDDSSGLHSPRALSPTGKYSDSLSPRSPSRSRSSDSLPSPRALTYEIGDTFSSGNKMGYVDKAGLPTSKVISQDHGNAYHADILNDSGHNNVNDKKDEPDHSNRENLPKNIVSSTRNVFEKYISAQPYKKPSPLSPRGHSSKSVHTLIAVDNLGNDEGETNTFETIPSSPPVIVQTRDKTDNVSNKDNQGYVSVSPAKNTQQEPTKTRSRYFGGVSPQYKSSKSSESNGDKSLSGSKLLQDKNANEMSYSPAKDKISEKSKESDIKKTKDTKNNQTVILINTTSQSLETNTQNRHSYSNNEGVSSTNGDLSSSVHDKISKVESSLKKRKAPSPPNLKSGESRAEKKKHVTSITLDNSKSSSIKSDQNKPEYVSEIEVTSSQSRNNDHLLVNQSKHEQNNKKPEASRQKLSLNLNNVSNNVESKQIVSSKQVKENPAAVIYNRSKKPKFKVPKAAGPGSLLIRPASNMVQGKNANLVSLEFKYNDIKTGDFAPAKKRPAYYDESSSDSDEDIPVTNIDDVIEGKHAVNGKDKNANVSKKTKKYDFIGQGVIMEKSCIRSRQAKMNITFADHATQTYEYPSQQSLLDTMPAELGDFDHPDTVYNVVSTPSDEEIPDMEEPSSSLKSTPGIGSGGTLAGYQTKMQVEFSFGMNPMESDVSPRKKSDPPPPVVAEDDTLVKPADEEDTFQWSENKTSDLLF